MKVKEEKDTGGQKNPVNEFFWILHILYPWVLLTKYQIFRIGFMVTFKEMFTPSDLVCSCLTSPQRIVVLTI